jgi:DNA-binding transcriptional MerR regulator
MLLPEKMKTKNPPKTIQIPDRLYFKIGEVGKITGLPAYVLRFWESEFSCIRPKRTSSGQRQYRKSDVEMILKIRQLLHEKKFTIQGAKQYLKVKRADKPESTGGLLNEVRAELQSIRDLLDG